MGKITLKDMVSKQNTLNVKAKYLPGDFVYCKFGKKYMVHQILTDGTDIEYNLWDGSEQRFFRDNQIDGPVKGNII